MNAFIKIAFQLTAAFVLFVPLETLHADKIKVVEGKRAAWKNVQIWEMKFFERKNTMPMSLFASKLKKALKDSGLEFRVFIETDLLTTEVKPLHGPFPKDPDVRLVGDNLGLSDLFHLHDFRGHFKTEVKGDSIYFTKWKKPAKEPAGKKPVGTNEVRNTQRPKE